MTAIPGHRQMTAGRIGSIHPTEAVGRASAGSLLLVDVRDAAEILETGKARGAMHIPLSCFAAALDSDNPRYVPALQPDLPIAIYCARGGRAGRAAQLLVDLGFLEVYNLGGFEDWRTAGGAIEPHSCEGAPCSAFTGSDASRIAASIRRTAALQLADRLIHR